MNCVTMRGAASKLAALTMVVLTVGGALAHAGDAAQTIGIMACPVSGDEAHSAIGDQNSYASTVEKIQQWAEKIHSEKPEPQQVFPEPPEVDRALHPPFPPPQPANYDGIADRRNLLNMSAARMPSSFTATMVMGDITIDGDLEDWTSQHRINLPLDRPPYLAEGDELYGKYVATPEPAYLIALRSSELAIGPNTTFWLNIDQDPGTGFQIWDAYGGAEYYVNVYLDSTLHLYNENFEWIGALPDYAYGADNTTLEIAIPVSWLSPAQPQQSIDLLGDINDAVFLFPQDFATGGQYTIEGTVEALPVRTDVNKRVGIVYSATTRDHFFDDKAYSQLFMSLQVQAMMAGVPFELLSEDDLTQLDKIVNFDALIFPYFSHVRDDILEAVHETLFTAIYEYDVGIITADNWMTNDESGQALAGDPHRYMKQLLGIERVNGDGPAQIELRAVDVSHAAMMGYTAGQSVIAYDDAWYNYYDGVSGQEVTLLADQTTTGNLPGVYPAMLATQTGGRHVHFATLGFMADTNLAWQAIEWVVFGDMPATGLKLSRNTSLFLARNDMDLAQEHAEVPQVHVPLLALIETWKEKYGFVGSYYIDIGNDPANGQWTDWSVSAPLFSDYIALGGEIGTHSWTHPHFTDELSVSELEFEFNQSMNEIVTQLGVTWQDQSIRGGAVPGAPELRATAEEIIQYLDYLSGGYSGVGAGYPNAIGFLTPDAEKVYFSPNMVFDFTLIEFGVPVGNPPVPVPLTAEEAEQYWLDEYYRLILRGSTPIIHWPWHDYGPTTAADPVTGRGYTVAMYENVIASAYADGAEFATLADARQRIVAFKNADLATDYSIDGLTITTNLVANDVGRLALAVDVGVGQVISRVDGWYAYSHNKVFVDADGGDYVIHLGNAADPVTRIRALPMRANLVALEGNGDELSFTLEGEGEVQIFLSGGVDAYTVTGADNVVTYSDYEIGVWLEGFGLHNVSVNRQ